VHTKALSGSSNVVWWPLVLSYWMENPIYHEGYRCLGSIRNSFSKDKAMVQPPHGMNVPGQWLDWLKILVWLSVHHSSRDPCLSVTIMARMAGS
jgi:hypothetical protein